MPHLPIALGVGDSRGNLNFLWKYIMFGLLLRAAYADHIQQEEYVMKSGLDWTIIRPAVYRWATNRRLPTRIFCQCGIADTKDLACRCCRFSPKAIE